MHIHTHAYIHTYNKQTSKQAKPNKQTNNTQQITHTYIYTNSNQSVQMVYVLPNQSDRLLVCNKSDTLYITNMKGQVIKSLSSKAVVKSGEDGKIKQIEPTIFVTCILSPGGTYAYCLGEDNHLYCFNLSTLKLHDKFSLSEKEVIGMIHHPYQNIIASYSVDGQLRQWSP